MWMDCALKWKVFIVYIVPCSGTCICVVHAFVLTVYKHSYLESTL